MQGPVDGDGVEDQLVAAPGKKINGVILQGRAYVFSRKTDDLIRKLDSPQPESDDAFFGSRTPPRSPPATSTATAVPTSTPRP